MALTCCGYFLHIAYFTELQAFESVTGLIEDTSGASDAENVNCRMAWQDRDRIHQVMTGLLERVLNNYVDTALFAIKGAILLNWVIS